MGGLSGDGAEFGAPVTAYPQFGVWSAADTAPHMGLSHLQTEVENLTKSKEPSLEIDELPLLYKNNSELSLPLFLLDF